MERTLKIQEATVQTVQVEIKALKVGKKQVTMGLFRQLPYAILLDPQTVQLRGLPWGHVNYWWDGDGSSSGLHGDKLHIVWQDGDTLRRGIVSQRPDMTIMARLGVREREHLTNGFLLTLPTAETFAVQRSTTGGFRSDVVLNGTAWDIRLEPPALNTLQYYWSMVHHDLQAAAQTKAQQEVEREQWALR